MARPIRETPILYGKDAERFVEEMKRVESLTTENISGCLHNGSSPKLFIHTCNRSSIIYKLNPLTSQCLYSSLYASYSSLYASYSSREIGVSGATIKTSS